MNHVLVGQLAGILAFLQIIPYIVSILRGKTKPERATYLIWFVINAMTISSYIAVGARTTIWAGLAFTISKLIILVLSIKRGMGGFSKFDITCLFLALVGIIIWVSTKSALLTLYFGTFVILIGYLPTIKKVYFLPRTENKLSWIMCTFASILNLFALTTLMPSISLLPISGAVADIVVVYLLLFQASRTRVVDRKKQHKIHALLTHPVFAK